MNTYDLLVRLEWAGGRRGMPSSSSMGAPNDGPTVPACPWCHQVKPTAKFATDFSEQYRGHTVDCELMAAIERERARAVAALLDAERQHGYDAAMREVAAAEGVLDEFVDATQASAAPTLDAERPRCDCGGAVTVCADCAVADYQAQHPDCTTCCPAPPTERPRWQPMDRDPLMQAAEAQRAECIRLLTVALGVRGVLPLTAEECLTILRHAPLFPPVPTAPPEDAP